MEYLGCTYQKFYDHLLTTLLPGMTWENHGEVWEIGHRKPLLEAGISEEETLRRLHWTNTFPQWKDDNRRQGNRFHWTKEEYGY